MSLLTNVKKRKIQVLSLLINVKKRGKSRFCHHSHISKKEGNTEYAIAHKCEPNREIQITVIAHNVKKREKFRLLHVFSYLSTKYMLLILVEGVSILRRLQ